MHLLLHLQSLHRWHPRQIDPLPILLPSCVEPLSQHVKHHRLTCPHCTDSTQLCLPLTSDIRRASSSAILGRGWKHFGELTVYVTSPSFEGICLQIIKTIHRLSILLDSSLLLESHCHSYKHAVTHPQLTRRQPHLLLSGLGLALLILMLRTTSRLHLLVFKKLPWAQNTDH